MLHKLLSKAVGHRPRGADAGAGAPAASMPHAAAGTASRAYTIVAVLAPALCLLYGLDSSALRDNNEGLYAEIAREMLSTGDFIVPHLNGVPYIEKPPLLYWLISLSMAVFGHTAAAARLVSAVSIWALCVSLYYFCSVRGNPRAGCYASVALASAVPVTVASHFVLFDPLLTALFGMCMLCCLHFHLTGSRRAYRLALVLLALAVLEKGAVALVLAGGTVGLFLLLVRGGGPWRRWLDPGAVALFLLVTVPWHVAAALSQEGFSWFYFVNEHLLRFLGRRLPDDYHRGPSWYYLPRLLAMVFPWTPFLLLLARPGPPAAPGERTIVTFCQAMTLFPLVFFSLSQAKADYYLLVTAPALALWLAMATAPQVQPGSARRTAWCWGCAAAGAFVLAAVVAIDPKGQWALSSVIGVALGWAALAALGMFFFHRLRSRKAMDIAMLAVALAVVPTLALWCKAAALRDERDSSRQIARVIGNALQRELRPRQVFIYRDYEDIFSTLPFYLGRPLPVIDSASRDLDFGCKKAPNTACISIDQFRSLQARDPVAVAVRAPRAAEFLAMAGERGWRIERVGEKLVFFSPE
ncbi:MAG: glycosyltransferase family 39 protein [Massilia sp.]|nr:glycosyltransferase family 39 protein [Massilia sp.]